MSDHVKQQVEKETIGDVLLDLEVILNKMATSHGLQLGDILALVHSHLIIHNPDCRETYTADGSHPVYYYGPVEGKP